MIFYEGHKVYMNGEYPAIYLNNQSVHIHRLEWMKYFGDIPNGFIIHHKDENKLNWNINNLELLSRSEHIKEHASLVHRKGVPVVAEKDGFIISFNSIEECAEYCGTYTSTVRRIFEGKQNQTKGWKFRRVVVQECH